MKHTIISIACLAVTTITIATTTLVIDKANESDLFKENVEALSRNENKDEQRYDYPDGYPFEMVCNVLISPHKRCKTIVITCQGGGKGCNESPCPVHSR